MDRAIEMEEQNQKRGGETLTSSMLFNKRIKALISMDRAIEMKEEQDQKRGETLTSTMLFNKRLKNLISSPKLSKSCGSREEEKERIQEEEDRSDGKACGICLLEEGKVVRGQIDSCDHRFCFVCILEWARKESLCPICKQRFRSVIRQPKDGVFAHERTVVIPRRDQVYNSLQNVTIVPSEPFERARCTECESSKDECLLLLCDLCDSASHTYCVDLGFTVPKGDWYCQDCTIAKNEHRKSQLCSSMEAIKTSPSSSNLQGNARIISSSSSDSNQFNSDQQNIQMAMLSSFKLMTASMSVISPASYHLLKQPIMNNLSFAKTLGPEVNDVEQSLRTLFKISFALESDRELSAVALMGKAKELLEQELTNTLNRVEVERQAMTAVREQSLKLLQTEEAARTTWLKDIEELQKQILAIQAQIDASYTKSSGLRKGIEKSDEAMAKLDCRERESNKRLSQLAEEHSCENLKRKILALLEEML